MATSGKIDSMQMTLQQLLDASFRACRIVPQNVSAEMLVNAKAVLSRFLNAFPARVTPMWARDQKLIGLGNGKRRIECPHGTLDLLTFNLREYTQVTPTATTTATTTRKLTFAAGETVSALAMEITNIASYEESFSILVETSADDITYTTLVAATDYTFRQGERTWIQFPAPSARYIRVSGFTNLAHTTEFFAGRDPRDTALPRVAMDHFQRTSNPDQTGKPTWFWLDRQYDNCYLNFWPIPDATYENAALSVVRQRMIQDPGTMVQTLEIPKRWEKPLIMALACDIAFDVPQIDVSIINMLKPFSDEWTTLLATEERDNTPIQFAMPFLRKYTR